MSDPNGTAPRDPPGDTGAVAAVEQRLRTRHLRPFLATDIRETALVAASRVAAHALPVEGWISLTGRFHRLGHRVGSARYARFANQVAAFFGADVDEAFVARLWRDFLTEEHRRRMQIVALGTGSAPRPRVQFTGADRLAEHSKAGKGIILWEDSFVHYPVVGKVPFAEAGFRGWQLSAFEHGFSRSRYGHRVLNPLQLDLENSLLKGRIVFGSHSVVAATRRVRDLLIGGEIVRITNNANIGRRLLRVRLGVGAWVPIAVTPIHLAQSTGAALLPVSTIAIEPFRHYEVAVGDPIDVGGAHREEAFTRVARRYAEHLEPLVRAHPEQWTLWSRDLARSEPIDPLPGR